MARRPTHDVAPRDALDRMAFLVAFALGVGGGLLLKALGVHPLLTAGYAALFSFSMQFLRGSGGG